MIDFIESDNTCYGIVCEDEFGERGAILAHDIILATGGIGGLFTNSTNYPHITGDSFALSLKHGVELQNINYIQIHPTTLYSKKRAEDFLSAKVFAARAQSFSMKTASASRTSFSRVMLLLTQLLRK